jgi:hypothetical protein
MIWKYEAQNPKRAPMFRIQLTEIDRKSLEFWNSKLGFISSFDIRISDLWLIPGLTSRTQKC